MKTPTTLAQPHSAWLQHGSVFLTDLIKAALRWKYGDVSVKSSVRTARHFAEDVTTSGELRATKSVEGKTNHTNLNLKKKERERRLNVEAGAGHKMTECALLRCEAQENGVTSFTEVYFLFQFLVVIAALPEVGGWLVKIKWPEKMCEQMPAEYKREG